MPSKPAAHSRVPYSEEKWYIHSKITHEGKERVKPVGAAVTVDVRWNRQGEGLLFVFRCFLAA